MSRHKTRNIDRVSWKVLFLIWLPLWFLLGLGVCFSAAFLIYGFTQMVATFFVDMSISTYAVMGMMLFIVGGACLWITMKTIVGAAKAIWKPIEAS